MEPIVLKIEKKRISDFIAKNTAGGSQLSDDFNLFSSLGAKAAGMAQRLRQEQLGDAETCANLDLESEKNSNPIGYIALLLESAHLNLAEKRNIIGAMSFGGGGAKGEHIDAYFDALMSLQDLYNEGLSLLHENASNKERKLSDLLNAVREELTHAKKIYGKSQCFVATIVYSDEYAPQVNLLRKIRDTVLERSPAGRLFICMYYGGVGKLIANWIAALPFTIPLVRGCIDRILKRFNDLKPNS
jgi:hypothetical protein